MLVSKIVLLFACSYKSSFLTFKLYNKYFIHFVLLFSTSCLR